MHVSRTRAKKRIARAREEENRARAHGALENRARDSKESSPHKGIARAKFLAQGNRAHTSKNCSSHKGIARAKFLAQGNRARDTFPQKDLRVSRFFESN